MPENSINIVLPTKCFATGVTMPGRSDVSQELAARYVWLDALLLVRDD